MLAATIAVAVLANPVATEPPRLMTVAIDLRALDRDTYEGIAASELYKNVVVRLMEEEVALVDISEPSDVVVRLSNEGTGRLRIRADRRERTVPIPLRDDEAAQLALMHAVLDLVRATLRDLEVAVPGEPAPTATTGSWAKPWARLQSGLLVGPGASASVDGAVGAGLGRMAAVVGGTVSAPLGLPSNLSVLEWSGYLGARVMLASWGRIALRGGADIGFLLSHYGYTDPTRGDDSGIQSDGMAALRAALDVRVSASLHIGIEVAGVATITGRRHLDPEGELWRATPVRVFVGAGLTYAVAD